MLTVSDIWLESGRVVEKLPVKYVLSLRPGTHHVVELVEARRGNTASPPGDQYGSRLISCGYASSKRRQRIPP